MPLQLLGYYLSVARGLDVDKPGNLAKNVTVKQCSATNPEYFVLSFVNSCSIIQIPIF